jgi:hypothetical protein
MMNKKYPYPVQMGSIKKNNWRLGDLIKKGLTKKELEKEEAKLFIKLKKLSQNTPQPPKTYPLFPNSKLLTRGWEWAVYELANKKEVVKVPANIFKEVNEPEYLENAEYAYDVCRKYLGEFTLETNFERIKGINTLRQRKIKGTEIDFITPADLSKTLRNNLAKLAKRMLAILKDHDWLPDMHFHPKKQKGKQGWNVWNLIIENDKPIIFDFTTYYDVFRLYPQRTKEEKKIKGKDWQNFLKELKNY